MKDDHCYKVQLVGNLETVKRMVASLFLVDSKKERQTLKVCICDDLPHVINAVDNQQRNSPAHELVQSGLILHVGFGRSLTVKASAQDDTDVCIIDPQTEVVIPPDAVWASNAAFAMDFQLQIKRPHENAAVQVSITSKDDFDSDIPLSVPPRVHVTWMPKDNVGVQRIRKTWEMNECHSLQRTPSSSFVNSSRSSSLSRNQHPQYQNVGKYLEETGKKQFQNGHFNNNSRKVSPLQKEPSADYSGPTTYSAKPQPVSMKDWNIVESPPPQGDTLPQWAKGYGDQYDYDDVLVV